MIINPMFFYMMHLSETFSMTFIIVGPVLILIGLILLAITLDSWISEEDKKLLCKWAKCMAPIGIIILFIGMLIPDEKTLLMMQAAKLATTDNVNELFESMKAAIDYAITILQ